MGSFPGRGMPTQNGLVPWRASRPPKGATIGRASTLTKWIDTRAWPMHRPAQWPPLRQAHHADAVAFGALGAQFHRLVTHHLAITDLAVQRQHHAAVGH